MQVHPSRYFCYMVLRQLCHRSTQKGPKEFNQRACMYKLLLHRDAEIAISHSKKIIKGKSLKLSHSLVAKRVMGC